MQMQPNAELEAKVFEALDAMEKFDGLPKGRPITGGIARLMLCVLQVVEDAKLKAEEGANYMVNVSYTLTNGDAIEPRPGSLVLFDHPAKDFGEAIQAAIKKLQEWNPGHQVSVSKASAERV